MVWGLNFLMFKVSTVLCCKTMDREAEKYLLAVSQPDHGTYMD